MLETSVIQSGDLLRLTQTTCTDRSTGILYLLEDRLRADKVVNGGAEGRRIVYSLGVLVDQELVDERGITDPAK
jgi:hypothetical protein